MGRVLLHRGTMCLLLSRSRVLLSPVVVEMDWTWEPVLSQVLPFCWLLTVEDVGGRSWTNVLSLNRKIQGTTPPWKPSRKMVRSRKGQCFRGPNVITDTKMVNRVLWPVWWELTTVVNTVRFSTHEWVWSDLKVNWIGRGQTGVEDVPLPDSRPRRS